MNGLIGRKLGMTRLFDEEGTNVPVTVIEAGPCPIVQVTGDRVQLGFEQLKAKRSPSSIAMGAIRLTVIWMLSPGITISVPAGSSTLPVTSVVRK